MQKGKSWTVDDLNFLKENWGVLTSTQLILKLNRTIKSIGSKAGKLGLKAKIIKKETSKAVPLQKMKGLTLHNSPGVRVQQKVFEVKPWSSKGKTPYRIDAKTVVYIPDTMTNEEAREVIKMYKDLKPAYLNK